LLAVLPGTLYKITGIGDASATFKMLIDSFLRRFIIIWRNRSIAANADKSLSLTLQQLLSIISPTPSTNGKLPLLASITVLITISFHLGIMLHFQPLYPKPPNTQFLHLSKNVQFF
jgi:hypothetical protein